MTAPRPLFSSSWYRVAGLRPRLVGHARIHRHRYRDEIWYVLQDRASARHHRFSPAAYLLIGLMDGERTVQELWDAACTRLGDQTPTQDETIQLLAQLHTADALQCDVPPDAAELFERHEKQERRRRLGRAASLFSWRVPLVDAERILRPLTSLARALFSPAGAVLWLLWVAAGFVLAAVHWHDLTHDLLDRMLAPGSILVLVLLFPLIKALHELGHGMAVKAFGGEVHEMGVMLLVLTPVPYVDASGASSFGGKWQRIVVGGAGMAVELALATGALLVWLSAEAGLVRMLAYNAILIAGLSTILFNANPLLRYDGYYMLADFLEIPNLRARGTRYLGYLCERYLFGRANAEPVPSTAGERVWFVIYSLTSFVYRIFVVVAIMLFLGDKLFLLAVLFAGVGVIGWVLVPAGKGVVYFASSPRLRTVRLRAIVVTLLLIALVGAGLGLVPVPYRSRSEGVIWVPEEAHVRASADGFIGHVVAEPGSRVTRGQPVVELRDPVLPAKVTELEARRAELLARYDEQWPTDRARADVIREELTYVTQQVADVRRRMADLTVRAAADGTFVVAAPEDLPGRFVRKGELLGYAVESETVTVRTVVSQAAIDLVRQRTARVDVRLAERLDQPVPAVIRRAVPGGSEQLPTTALGVAGGGQIAVDPRDGRGVTAIERVFQVDLELPVTSRFLNVGGRAYVRFDHGREPLLVQWYVATRQLFLTRFNV